MEKIAKNITRKSIEKTLNKARRNFAQAKSDFDTASAELRAAQARVADAHSRLDTAKSTIIAESERLRIMDLTGSNSMRARGDELNYVINGQEYHIDANDINNIEMVPWKEYKSKKNAPEESVQEEACAEDDELNSYAVFDELLEGSDSFSENNQTNDLPENYEEVLETVSDLKTSENKLEYLTVVSEFKDMAKGLPANGQRELNYSNWKDSHFIKLLEDVHGF